MHTSPQTQSRLAMLVILLVLGASLIAVSWQGLSHPELEGLDGAHHVMDGVFFRDLLTDLPTSNIASYPFNYYKQYPALGFIFWPPLFPLIEGVVFKIGGISLFNAQVAVLLFGGLLLTAFFFTARRQLPTVPALTATLLLLTAPGLYQYFNVVMREVPMLAMMALTTLLYFQVVSDARSRLWKWLLLATIAAMSLYTKQTAFILFPALAIDLLTNHRHLLRSRHLWMAVVALVVLLLPLALFTLKFGKANIAQSIGQNTQLIMSGYQGMPRWSFENWRYYLGTFPSMLHGILLVLAAAEIVLSLFNRERLKRNTLWLAWLVSFYLVFSYFDNKSDRFAVLVIPPLCMLAAHCLWSMLSRLGEKTHPQLASAILLAPLIASLNLFVPLQTLHGTHAIMDQVDVAGMDGNIAYWGQYRQAFVYDIRRQDLARTHFVLQGGDLVTDSNRVSEQLHDYRIRYLLVEPNNLSPEEQAIFDSLTRLEGITELHSATFFDRSTAHSLVILRNDNPLAERMKPIELSSRLVN